MIRNFRFAFAALFVAGSLFAQIEGEAKTLLDRLSEKTKGYKTVELNFTFIMEGGGINETRNGFLRMSGDKYRLEMDSLVIISDGKTVYSIRQELCEAQAIPVDELDEDALTPQSMFTIYEKGFKGKIKERKSQNGRKLVVIDLFPLKPKEKEYSIVRLDIDEEKLQIVQALVIAKNGTRYTYRIDRLTPDKEMVPSLFRFEAAKFPCVQLID
jgi:outer membrane lipoprotein-sorting protein